MKVIAHNRKALHDYAVVDSYEAGMVLEGGEVKSLRQGSISMSDAYADFRNGEVYVFNLHIAPYKFSSGQIQEPKRRRKLLLQKNEIRKLYGALTQKGNALIPLKVYFNDHGFAKVSIGLCHRKRLYDKKEKILKRESDANLKKVRRSAP
jgi:SsrA-binding protein